MKAHAFALFAGLIGMQMESLAQPYPAKPLRLIAPSTPASPSDIRARWGPIVREAGIKAE